MGRPLGPAPDPQTYREFLAVQIRKRAIEKFGTTPAFQQALADRGLHIEVNQLHRWFLALRFPEITHLRTVADALDCTTDALLPPCPDNLLHTQFAKAVPAKRPPKRRGK